MGNVYETNGLQTAIGLVAAGLGISIVPASVQRLKRDDTVYRPVAQQTLVSPMLMTTREGDTSRDLAQLCAVVQAACGPLTAGPVLSTPRKKKAPASRPR